MHFCKICNNMYYIKLSDSDSNNLNYYCRNCGSIDDSKLSSNVCISKTNINETSNKLDIFINKYTKLDPTLPRTNSIKCPNDKCTSNTEVIDDDGSIKNTREVLYIRYDDINMKYLYVCCNCNFTWKTNIS